jgi:hypothetical protein
MNEFINFVFKSTKLEIQKNQYFIKKKNIKII